MCDPKEMIIIFLPVFRHSNYAFREGGHDSCLAHAADNQKFLSFFLAGKIACGHFMPLILKGRSDVVTDEVDILSQHSDQTLITFRLVGVFVVEAAPAFVKLAFHMCLAEAVAFESG
jgi:hypothetical protein